MKSCTLPFRLKPSQLHSCASSCKLPVNLAAGFIGVLLPCCNFPPQRLLVRYSAGQALSRKDADLDISHIQLTSAPRRLVPIELDGALIASSSWRAFIARIFAASFGVPPSWRIVQTALQNTADTHIGFAKEENVNNVLLQRRRYFNSYRHCS